MNKLWIKITLKIININNNKILKNYDMNKYKLDNNNKYKINKK